MASFQGGRPNQLEFPFFGHRLVEDERYLLDLRGRMRSIPGDPINGNDTRYLVHMCTNEHNREEPYLYQLIGWVPRNSQKMRGLVYSTDGGSSSWNLVDVPGLIILHVPVYKPVRPVRLTGEGLPNYMTIGDIRAQMGPRNRRN